MWSATAVIVLAALAAAVVAAVLLRAHTPPSGYRALIRDAFATRAERRGPQAPQWREEPGEELGLEDLHTFAESGPGYEVAPDLREVFRRHLHRH